MTLTLIEPLHVPVPALPTRIPFYCLLTSVEPCDPIRCTYCNEVLCADEECWTPSADFSYCHEGGVSVIVHRDCHDAACRQPECSDDL